MKNLLKACLTGPDKRHLDGVLRCVSVWLLAVVLSGCQSGHETVFDAAYHGDLEAVREFVEEGGVKGDAEDKFGNQVLFHAVSGNHLDVVNYLIERGADPLIRSQDGSSLLHLAAGAGNIELATRLIEVGCAVDGVDVNGESPLMMAILAEHESMTQLLIAKGASVTLTNGTGATPLSVAAKKGWTNLLHKPVTEE